jgi:hypothetical protein
LEERALPSVNALFDTAAGELLLRGDGGDNVAQQALSPAGFLELTLDGYHYSSDPASAFFDPALAGASAATLATVRFEGGGQDTLTLAAQQLPGRFAAQAPNLTVDGVLCAAAVSLRADEWLTIEAVGQIDAGSIDLTADRFANSGQLRADDGAVAVDARNVLQAGLIRAEGGAVRVAFTGAYIDTAAALTSAPGGRVVINGGTTGRLFSSGKDEATGTVGGAIDLLGREVLLVGATVDASGDVGGGSVRIGGDFQGNNLDVAEAQTVTVTAATTIRADALRQGDGGRVVVWADQQTAFDGAVSARGGPAGGAGGFLELSGKGNLAFGGTADAAAPAGKAGTLLLDPKNIVIVATPAGLLPQYNLIDPNPNPDGRFGSVVQPLSNGNVVVTDWTDNFGGSFAGAAYLFNGVTGALISAVVGSHPNDLVGALATVLSNGNYVIQSQFWNSYRGAVTWGSATAGVSGVVSASNSLVGGNGSDRVGGGQFLVGGVTALPNGNYVVRSPEWNNRRGAATWGSGTAGVSGVVSDTNSLVGSNPNDAVGGSVIETLTAVTPLDNGNYLVHSPDWNGDRGAVTWGGGTRGITGVVSATNSLVGSTTGDELGMRGGFIGDRGILTLSNGNYVVLSPFWNQGRGAVTWGSAASGVAGAVSAGNSLVGTNPTVGTSIGDQVGREVTLLSNGNYVAYTVWWNNLRGAATWGDGATGITGTVSAANSLVGTAAGDDVGFSVTALTNGNYVVASSNWNGGRGAATWGNGATGITGTVSAANSLVGTAAGDGVGGSVTALTNGNYVVVSWTWNGNRGAATWGDGTSGIAGTVTADNSLVGSDPNDQVGRGISGTGVAALSNGNYVVESPFWNGQRGAATWGNGTTGVVGAVSSDNSLVGSNPLDRVGTEITPLTNGNYVAFTTPWGGNVGAATWGDGTTGVVGPVSADNSLVGSNPNDLGISPGVVALSNGNYLVRSYTWNNNRGMVTWASGTAGVTGSISAANSLVGTNPGDQVGFGTLELANGNFIVSSPSWAGGRGAVTWVSGTAGVVGEISTANSIVGSSTPDGVGQYGSFPVGNSNYVLWTPKWNGNRGAATWVNGTTGQTFDGSGTISAANSILGVVANSWLDPQIHDNPAAQTFLAAFIAENGGRVTVGVMADPGNQTFASFPAQSIPIAATSLTSMLNAGTAVVLQASNDITVNAPITVSAGGQGGALTLQAGRSILINASITTDNGALALIANDTLASGVADAQRDPGNAVINLAAGASLNTGSGALTVELRDGNGRTNRDSGAITLGAVTAGTTSVLNNGPSANSDVFVGPVTTGGAQSYSTPNGTTRLTGNVTAADSPITFAQSVVVNDGVTVSAGADTIRFAADGTQTLQTGNGASLGDVNHTGTGTLQVISALNVTGSFTNTAGAFDANDQAVTITGPATILNGTYLAGTATQTFSGGLLISGGQFTSSTGPMAVVGAVTVSGGLLSGTGTLGPLTVQGGTVAPGLLSANGAVGLSAAATFQASLNGSTPGSGYSQLNATGPVDLGGAQLNVVLGFVPELGSSFELITTSDPAGITGTFAGLDEGAIFNVGGFLFQITYQGGASGRSVVLTRVG